MKRLLPILVLITLLGPYNSALAQTPRESEVIKELLAAPAPPPNNTVYDSTLGRVRSEDFFAKTNVPPDDAPLEDLADYWTRSAYGSNPPSPTDTVRQRLLDGYVDDPKTLTSLLPLFSPSERYAEKIKQAFDNAAAKPENANYRSQIKTWLVFNSKYFLNELLVLAQNVSDSDTNAWVENAAALASIAKLDWSLAEPLLETLVKANQLRSSTFALRLLYEHSVTEKQSATELTLRSKLLAIAADRSFPGSARNIAIDALSASEWSGQDDWYLSLLSDESFNSLEDGNHHFTPLSILLAKKPDKWIPVLTKMVAGKDRRLQQTAASCLVRYAVAEPRRDAIMPVLRWLTEPDWLPIGDRSRFIRTMAEVDVPESVPGLIWIVENEENNRPWAARALARYQDSRAIPALKKALAEVSGNDRKLILEGLLASGGLTDAEQVEALEAYATTNMTAASREEIAVRLYVNETDAPLPVSIGRYLARLKSPADTVVRATLVRAAHLQTKNAALSRTLLLIAHNWQGRQVYLDMIDRIAAHTAPANTIRVALQRRDLMRETVKSEMHLLIASSGTPKGIGAILLDDNDVTGSILSANDQMAQIGVLTAARLTLTSLAIDQVGPLLKSKNSMLAMAAERYLRAEDSKEARAALWQYHRNEAFVTGWREYDTLLLPGNNFARLDKQEAELRAELFKPGGPTEIFAVLDNSERPRHVLRIYPDKAVNTDYEDATRYHEREVSQKELSVFREFVSTNGVADLGPQFGSCSHECYAFEFLMLAKGAARRVFILGWLPGRIDFRGNFLRLGNGDNIKTHYNFESEVKNLEVLYADQKLTVHDVWQRDNEIRIFVERPETAEEAENRQKVYPDEGENEEAERLHREFVQRQSRMTWRTLKDKDAGAITSVPDGYSTFDFTRFPFDENDTSSSRDEYQVQVLGPDAILFARNLDGLWKQTVGTKPVRISEGEEGGYARPIVTPDGKWAVIAKTDSNWYVPNYLVRLNLETGQESRVQLERADQLDPVAFIPQHEKILVYRAKDRPEQRFGNSLGPEADEYYLIDPKSGEVQPVSGEFAPLSQLEKRFLQPTGEPNQYWAAIHYKSKNETVVGRYNLKDFSFKPILTVPKIEFNSRAMWVDEKQQKLYFVYKGQLLRLPLQSLAAKVRNHS